MNTSSISRRQMLKLVGLALASTVVDACAPKPPKIESTPAPQPTQPEVIAGQPTTAATAAQPAEKTYKILFWAQAAEPTDPNAQLAPDAKPHLAYQTVADDYRSLHPNTTVEWYRFPASSTFSEWLLARMTAEDCPDVFWSNTEDLWPHVSKGWILDFTEPMNQPNPYVPGNQAWKDQFDDVAIISQTGPDGKLYGVNMDGTGVLTLYNKNAFAEASITQLPKTWTEFINACQKLKDKGYIPFGADCSAKHYVFHWLEAHVYNQLLYDDIYKWDDDQNKVITARELANHYQKGDFPDWDAFKEMAHLFKQMVPFFPTGYEGELDYVQLWRKGTVAMYMEGNWIISELKASPPPFGYDWLAFPIIAKDIWPKSQEKIVRIQGAWGAMQYHVPAFLAKKDPDKVKAVMDWLMFSSKPENVSKILQDTATLPLTKGAQGMAEMAPFEKPYDRAVPYQSWCTLDCGSGLEAEHRLWQAYLPSNWTDDELLQKAHEALDAEVKKVLEANPDWKVG